MPRARLAWASEVGRFSTGSSIRRASSLAAASVELVVSSPPFVDEVDYRHEHWLRWWFCGIDPDEVSLTIEARVDVWQDAMTDALTDLRRVLRPGGYVAFEVGDVQGGSLMLEDLIVPAMVRAGLQPLVVVVNAHRFTKTAHISGVSNNHQGTNTNRVVLASRPKDGV